MGPFVHTIDPVIATVGGVHLWWYGASYALGFLNAHLFVRRHRAELGLSLREVYDLTLFLAVGVLAGGRALVVVVNEWPFYSRHLELIPALWIGGLATHGLLIGGFAGVALFCALYRNPFRPLFDVLAIAAAVIMGCGRIGNFIDGQIVGSVTDVPWGVRFPYADGYRHPVVLYDGLKNFILVPLLLWVRGRGAPPGRVATLFVLLYAGLRIPIDFLREYPLNPFGLPTGQTMNVLMTAVGAGLLLRSIRRAGASGSLSDRPEALASGLASELVSRGTPGGLRGRQFALAALMLAVLVIPSDATRDVPKDYSPRHPGIVRSPLYPSLE